MNGSPFATHVQVELPEIHQPVLKVLGLGGGGCNAVQRMIELGMRGIEFIVANTDHQDLENNSAPVKIQLGPKVTRGLGAGGDPRIGKAAAEESGREIAAALAGADMVFLTAGMGGGTGTGSIPVAAEIARALGAVVIGIVTTPFSFEMGRRAKNAREGLAQLQKFTHTLIAIPNDRLLCWPDKNLPIETAFRLADDVLRQAVQGIAELITEPGLVNVDFAHVRRLMRLGGGALMAIGQGRGENKVSTAIKQALHHPLLENVLLDNAKGVIANFTGAEDFSLFEMDAALNQLRNQVGDQAEIFWGFINDERMEDRVQLILMITGLGAPTLEETLSSFKKPEPVLQAKPEPIVQAKPEPVLPVRPEPAFPARPEPAFPARPERVTARTDFAPASQNLDVPAFMRRKTRPAN